MDGLTELLRDRYPPDRVASAVIALLGAFQEAADEIGVDLPMLLRCQWVSGYLWGFSSTLDGESEVLSGGVRRVLFSGLFSDEGDALASKGRALLFQEGHQTLWGFDAGLADGWRFFGHLREGEHIGQFALALSRAADMDEIAINLIAG